MRILLWYWGRRGGGAQFTLALARAMAHRRGLETSLSLSRQGDLTPAIAALGLPCDQVDTYRDRMGFLLGTLRIPLLARRLVAQAREMRADVVISGMTHLWTPLVAPALARAGIPYVPVVHDGLPHPGDPAMLWNWRLDTELRRARGAIALSSAVEAVLHARRPDLPILRLPIGAHLPADIPPRAAPAEGPPTFLFFGRLRAYKGLDLLRDAWAMLPPGLARLRVVGEGDIEACAPGLAALPGVTVESRWVGDTEMVPLVAGAHAVVLPYREASQSGVAPIALACGVPVLGTAVGGLAEQIPDGTGGLLVPPEPAALAEGLRRLLDPATHRRLSEGALAAGAALGDWDGMLTTLLDGLHGLGIAGKACPP